MIRQQKRLFNSIYVVLVVLIFSYAPMYASAEQSLEEITVTATRVAARLGYEAPTPTTVLDSEFIGEMGLVNVADALNRLPSMGSANSPRTNANLTSTPTQGANFLNLRGLGTNRTLVLLDGRRVVGAAVTVRWI